MNMFTLDGPGGVRLRFTAFSSLWLLVLIAVVGAALVFARSRAVAPAVPESTPSPLPFVGDVPEFSMTERDGRTITNADLTGQPWVANFVFTTCPGPCPRLSARMSALQREIVQRGWRVRLVSFSVDPLHDTPKVLQHYARRFKADPAVWWFLTCDDEPKMYELVEKGFLQSVVAKTDESALMHSNYMVIVDGRGRLRAFHAGLDAGATERIVIDLQKLLTEHIGA